MGSLILDQITVTYMVTIFGYLYMLVTIPPTKLCPIWLHTTTYVVMVSYRFYDFPLINTSHMATYGRVWLHINSARTRLRNAGSEMQVRECRLGNAGTGIKVLTIQNIRVEYHHHRMQLVTTARQITFYLRTQRTIYIELLLSVSFNHRIHSTVFKLLTLSNGGGLSNMTLIPSTDRHNW